MHDAADPSTPADEVATDEPDVDTDEDDTEVDSDEDEDELDEDELDEEDSDEDDSDEDDSDVDSEVDSEVDSDEDELDEEDSDEDDSDEDDSDVDSESDEEDSEDSEEADAEIGATDTDFDGGGAEIDDGEEVSLAEGRAATDGVEELALSGKAEAAGEPADSSKVDLEKAVGADPKAGENAEEGSTEGEDRRAAAAAAGVHLAEVLIDPEDDLQGIEGEASLRLVSIVESLLFAATKPLKVKDIRRVIGETSKRQVQLALKHLVTAGDGRGVIVAQVAGGFQMRTHPENATWVQRLLQAKPVRLSRSQLEALSIVAYRQPITRPEVDQVRGVDSGAVLRALLERELVQIVGKKEEVGRPLLYGTTLKFLEFFNLCSLRDLPTLRDFRELSDESKATLRKRYGAAEAEALGQEVLSFAGGDAGDAGADTVEAAASAGERDGPDESGPSDESGESEESDKPESDSPDLELEEEKPDDLDAEPSVKRDELEEPGLDEEKSEEFEDSERAEMSDESDGERAHERSAPAELVDGFGQGMADGPLGAEDRAQLPVKPDEEE